MLIFPLATFFFLVLGLYRRFASRLILREAFLLAAVAWSVMLILLTESLSALEMLSFPCLSVAWIVMTVFAIGLCVFTSVDSKADAQSLDLSQKFVQVFEKLKHFDMLLFGLIMVVLICTALSAGMAPPNNWDSLVYHMGRIPHWIENQSIAHYPTQIKTQIYYPPFAEWVILHFQILSGGDRFANFVQWFSMLGCAVAASLVVRLFGCSGRVQLFAVFFTVTIPMGILQASSTQNDAVLSFWLITFVYAGLRARNNGTILDAFMAGGALGVAVLTKALALILAGPFLLWFLIAAIKKHGEKIIVPLIVAVLLVVALNVNHWGRNVAVCGHLLGEEEVFGMTRNEAMSSALFTSNVVRNIGLHMATSIKPCNKFVEKTIAGVHEFLGISSIDAVNTLGITPLQISVSTHEDTAGNFLQLMLFAAAAIIILIHRKKFSGALVVYLVALFAAFIVFNLLLKWQPAGSRLHLPFFVLVSPLVAVVVFSFRRNWLIYAIVAVLFATSVPYVFRNNTRKLFSSKKTVFQTPRLRQYFVADETLLLPYQQAVDFVMISGCRQVGLRIGDNSWEYPFWVLFGEERIKQLRIEQVDVVGVQPLNYPLGAFSPCAIIETGRNIPSDNMLTVDGKIFKMQWEQSPVRVYLPQQ
jgi:4-amino-4-deoxy-L-arabinose transferase-like glycosyltransferase